MVETDGEGPLVSNGGTIRSDSELLSRSDQLFVAILGFLCLVLMAGYVWRISERGTHRIEILRQESQKYSFQIDVNRATWVEWMQLDGVGEITARKIVAEVDQNGPFSSIDDVQRVNGIGPKTLEKMRPYLSCESCE